jgi:hypothetical protein
MKPWVKVAKRYEGMLFRRRRTNEEMKTAECHNQWKKGFLTLPLHMLDAYPYLKRKLNVNIRREVNLYDIDFDIIAKYCLEGKARTKR